MRIGEYLINEKIITQETLNKALVLQKSEKKLLLGEILVKIGGFSKEDLSKYIQDYMDKLKESVINDTSQWLSQEDVDKLSSQYFKRD